MIDYCAPPSPCQNGATCTSFVSGSSCHCGPGYTGDKCGQEIDYHCANNPCLNDGTCINMVRTTSVSANTFLDHILGTDIQMLLSQWLDWFSL